MNKNLNFIKPFIENSNKKNSISFIDSENIVWKFSNSKWIGKRSVYTFDFSSCWLEDTIESNIKYWLCGKNADYDEIFIYE